ncbi:cytochrome c oxidase assembly factor 3, mitochondrial [Culicoides brevitarsis]|uniref:cytochrome c oxidase assembly factor 3, mitochondrial n=1 Tax=Culicoides brevitarsis TaxID=469753 RepID=UPI00307BEEFF
MSQNNVKEPKVSGLPEGVKLNAQQLQYMKLIEAQNLERVRKLEKLKKNNRIVCNALIGTALSIYFYSMYKVKQETFLDDFEEPKKIEVEPQ